MPAPIQLRLTPHQREQLRALFNEVRAKNMRGEESALMAQILPDGMIVKNVSGDNLKALMHALGADPSNRQRSVKSN